MSTRTGSLLVVVFFLSLVAAIAQPDPNAYEGLRLSVYGVSVKKQKPERLSLKVSVANTGRLPVQTGSKSRSQPENILIELDTFNLPSILQGREHYLSDAVRKERIDLRPGDIIDDLSVEVDLPRQAPADSGTGCPDLVFDTAFIVQYNEKDLLLRYILRNAGNASIQLTGKDATDDLAIQVHFVAGNKLTRGAIAAGVTNIRKGRETLDGLLLPGQALEGEIKIDLEKRTRFAPNLVFELDPGQTSRDCNRLNNTFAVIVEF
jgi:hypothetical protein